MTERSRPDPERARGPRHRRLGVAVAVILWVVAAGPAVAQAPRGTVVGKVSDDRGSPLATACLHLEKHPAIRACADRRGVYLLQHVPAGAVVLVFEAPGFIAERREVDVQTSALAIIEATLHRSPLDLEGVTATSERRVERGASMAVVERRTFRSPDEIARVLRDAVVGLRAASGGGQVGAGSGVRIRGVVSVTQGNAPLVYLDGIRLATRPVPGPAGANQTISALSSISPANVERIEVLRGAAATTLYGMEASSGVLLITTRRGGNLPP